VDGATLVLTLAVAGADSNGTTAGVVFLTGYGFGGPTVHWMHEKVGTGFASLGLRVGLPLTGAILGAVVADCGSGGGGEFCGVGEVAVGLLLGMGAAIAVDSAVLAREPVEPESAVGFHSLRLSPSFAADGSRASLLVTGNF
jgi:hypothetical protein